MPEQAVPCLDVVGAVRPEHLVTAGGRNQREKIVDRDAEALAHIPGGQVLGSHPDRVAYEERSEPLASPYYVFCRH